MTTEELAASLPTARRTSSGWEARCPAHDDKTASLSVSQGEDGRTLIHCHAGCTAEAVVSAMGLRISDLFPPRDNGNVKTRIVAEYSYVDGEGKLLFQVVRFDPKGFRQRRPDPDHPDGWLWNLNGTERVLYRLPRILDAHEEQKAVFVVEGEKDAEAFEKLGLTATCNSGGAGKWQESYTNTLVGLPGVIVIADKDEPGRKHAQLVAQALDGHVKMVKVLELPDRTGAKVKDAADWVQAGGTLDELSALVKGAPDWTPSQTPTVVAIYEQSDLATVTPIGCESTHIKARFFEISQTKGLVATEERQRMVDVVLDALRQRGRFFFHADHRNFQSCMFFDSHQKLLLPIASDQFLAWLAGYIGINRTERNFNSIVAAIQDEALTGKRTTGLTPEIYWAARPGALYLSNGDGHAVKISAGRVELVDNGTDDVLFYAGRTLRPWTLTDPVDPVKSCRLFSDMKAVVPHAGDLLRLWLLSLPTNQRCKPPLVFSGPIGGGKTRVAVGVSELYGIVPRVLKMNDTKETDFWTSLDAGGLVCFDNADTHVKWLADALAAASTDGANEKRRLYSDSDIIHQRARAWVFLTSMNPTFASDAGLSDRLLVIRLERRNSETAESALSEEIAKHRNSGLSFIAKTLSRAMADTAPVPEGLNRRHPDFAAFAVRLGRAIGREAEAVAALRAAEADKAAFNLENDDLGAGLLELLPAGSSLSVSAAELLGRLQEMDVYFSDPRWTVKRLGKRLAKLWPHIESMFQARSETGHGRVVIYSFRRVGEFGEFQKPFSNTSHARET